MHDGFEVPDLLHHLLLLCNYHIFVAHLGRCREGEW
jgi:hypothetical protein